jgi:outer membrane protein OmpA-like peptidoglycan-associated protein
MRTTIAALLVVSCLPFPTSAQQAPVTETTVDALIEALTPKPELKLRGLDVTAAAPSVDLAVEFAYNSANLTDEAKSLLSQLAAALNSEALGSYRFALAGHTDAVGSEDYNLALSTARAQSVQAFLSDEYGIAAGRLEVKGFGETQLLFPDSPEDGRNRRVEITTLKQ